MSSDAQRKAAKKYLHEKVENIQLRVPKGKKSEYKKLAEKSGESLNSYIINAIEARKNGK